MVGGGVHMSGRIWGEVVKAPDILHQLALCINMRVARSVLLLSFRQQTQRGALCSIEKAHHEFHVLLCNHEGPILSLFAFIT